MISGKSAVKKANKKFAAAVFQEYVWNKEVVFS